MSYKTNSSAVNALVDLKLVNYTNTTDLTTALALKADSADLADYVLSTALTTTLADYVLTTALTSTLAGYTSDADLTTALADYQLSAEAFSGAYADLTGTPDLGTASAEDVAFFATAAQGALADSAIQSADLTTALADYALTVDTYTKTEVDDLIAGVVAGDVDTSVQAVAVITTATTLTATNQLVIVNNGAATTTVTLDAAPATGKTITVKDGSGNASGFNITIAGNGKNIDGAASLIINVNYEAVSLAYNGTQWNIV